MAKEKPPKKKRSFLGRLWRSVAKNTIPLGDTLVDVIDGGDPTQIIDAVTKEPNMSQEHKDILIKEAQDELERDKMDAEDRKDARANYDKSKQQADRLSNQIMTWNLWGILGLLLVNIGVLIASKKWEFDESIVLIVGNLIGIVSQALLAERGQVVSFYFGSSLGSKRKTEQLDAKKKE